MRARHTEVDAEFVEKDERITTYAPETSPELDALGDYPVGVALVRVKRFFFRVRPSAWSTRPIVGRLTRMCVRRENRFANSSTVASGFSATSARTSSMCASSTRGGTPPA
jgi:hypothetical protein